MPILLSKREQSKVAANLERRQIGEQFTVLDPARLPETPFSPNRPLLLLVGLALGLALGASLAGLPRVRDTSLRSEADVMRRHPAAARRSACYRDRFERSPPAPRAACRGFARRHGIARRHGSSWSGEFRRINL